LHSPGIALHPPCSDEGVGLRPIHQLDWRLGWNFARPGNGDPTALIHGHTWIHPRIRPVSCPESCSCSCSAKRCSCSPKHSPRMIPSAAGRILICGSGGTSPSPAERPHQYNAVPGIPSSFEHRRTGNFRLTLTRSLQLSSSVTRGNVPSPSRKRPISYS
jgi:hypothetical protein